MKTQLSVKTGRTRCADKLERLARETTLEGQLVAYISPARKQAWVVQNYMPLIENAAKEHEISRITEFPSASDLLVLADITDPLPGDSRTFVKAKCREKRHSICRDECRQIGGEGTSYIKETDIVKPLKQCERDSDLPETATCTETYKKSCVEHFYKDSACKDEIDKADSMDWQCQ